MNPSEIEVNVLSDQPQVNVGTGATGEAARAACDSLEAWLRARAPRIHDSTPMVRQLSIKVADELGLDHDDQSLVELSAQVRDIGMIGLPDEVILNTGRLSPGGWEQVTRHPVLGSKLLSALPAIEMLAPIVRSHHERWDGRGYPDGLAGEQIPLASRILAVCDAFVAISSDRPHRRGLGYETALEHVAMQRGKQFDPAVIDGLVGAIACDAKATISASPAPCGAEPKPQRLAPGRAQSSSRSLSTAIKELDVLSVFAPARERLLAATAAPDAPLGSEVIATIESDIALTVAVLRQAQAESASRQQITNVPDAVDALSPVKLHCLTKELPAASFPWRTPFQALLHHARVHGQAVARAAQRLARLTTQVNLDDLLTAALLHDVGKLVLALAGRAAPVAARTTPEERLRRERRVYGTDHASLGGLLVSRWQLSGSLSEPIATHHRAEDHGELATVVRLADMVAHQAYGSEVDRRAMLRLASAVGVSATEVRDVLFDLPHMSGSQRRRSEPSPLSDRETAVLRLLAEGQLYTQIAHALTLSVSTVRSHLHNTYGKLGVPDRAQAVLRATDMAWI